MKTKFGVSFNEVKRMTTTEIRDEFLIQNLFVSNEINYCYAHYDRMIIGGAIPTIKPLALEINKEIGAQYLLERRELGIINIGGVGIVEHDLGQEKLETKDGLYLPVKNKKIIFKSLDANNPAKFYFVSTLGLISYQVVKIDIQKSTAMHLGNDAESNKRTIYKYFDPTTCQTNSLLMGMTLLAENNMWNTMPCHLHDRRSEAYLYFDMSDDEVVFHFMGQPLETRHLVVKNNEVVVSPYWSIHSGVGTKNYSFIWVMGGENISYADVVKVDKKDMQ